MIEAAQGYYPGVELARRRYYLVDAFTPVDFRKVSPGGMMGHSYFDIGEIAAERLPRGLKDGWPQGV